MRSLFLLSVIAAAPLLGCASASSTHNWDAETIDRISDVQGYEFERDCEANSCDLVHTVKGSRYVVPLDPSCAKAAKFCMWSQGLVELYIPDSEASQWRYRGSDYKSTKLAADRWLVEQFKDGDIYAAYTVDLNNRQVNYVIQEDEICIDGSGENQLCFNMHPGKYLAFEVRL